MSTPGPGPSDGAPPDPGPTPDAASRGEAPEAWPADGDPLWRRMHPVTPVVQGWKVVAVLAALAAQQATSRAEEILAGSGDAWDWARSLPLGASWLFVLIGVGIVLVAAAAWSWLSWRMTRFAVGDQAVHLVSGVVFRTRRQARIDRLQAVDLAQPLLARMVGLAGLQLEVAGGAGSQIRLAYLREEEARALRADLLAHAAGLTPPPAGAEAPPAATPSDADAAVGAGRGPGAAGAGRRLSAPAVPEAQEAELYSVPPGRLIASLALSGFTFWVLVALVALAVSLVGVLGDPRALVGALFAVGPAVLGVLGWGWSRFNRDFAFRAAVAADGMRLSHGLTEHRAQTVPPGRVQLVGLTQPLLWRRKDWWRVEINVAGYAREEEGQATRSVLLPVGSRQEAERALWLVLPSLAGEEARERTARACYGVGPAEGFVCAPRRARWLAPIAWRRLAYAHTDAALLLRSGRLTRRVVVVPHERTQSLAVAQGPLQRALGLADFTAHSTPGPVHARIEHLAADDAARLVEAQAVRARAARAVARPERWMRPAEEAGPGPGRSAE